MEVKRFCKQIKPNMPKYLEIPRPFFCESMTEFLVLESANKGNWTLKVEKSLTGDHYITWRSFASRYGICNGDIVLFKHLHTNHIGIEVYSPSGVLKNGHHGQQVLVISSSESSEESMEEDIHHCRRRKLQRRRSLSSSSSSSSESAGRKRLRSPSTKICASSRLRLFNGARGQQHQLHWVRNSKPEHFAQGTENAIATARTFQGERLSSPSLLIVLPGYSNISYFPKAFADEYCPWGNEHIELKDEMHETWIVQWQHPKIGSGFQKFATAHNLHRGDVCVFEVKKKGFLVHTFRAKNACLKGKAAMDQQENQKKQRVLNESIKLEEHPDPQVHGPRRPLFRNSRSSRSPGRNSNEIRENRDSGDEPREDHFPVADALAGDMQLQISFGKDAAGVLRPQVSAVIPLEQSQLSQMLGPSVFKDLLDALKRIHTVIAAAGT